MIKTNYTETLWNCYIDRDVELHPEYYLDCKDRDEVEDLIWELDIVPQVNYGDVNVGESERFYTIPEEFWVEWERLKELDYHSKLQFED